MNDKVLNELSGLFKKYPSVERAVLFGSRARGDATERSDYDIAVFGTLSVKEITQLRVYCSENIHTLHKVDLIFMSVISDKKLIENINGEGIVFYDKV